MKWKRKMLGISRGGCGNDTPLAEIRDNGAAIFAPPILQLKWKNLVFSWGD